jgi:hypothetical protein
VAKYEDNTPSTSLSRYTFADRSGNIDMTVHNNNSIFIVIKVKLKIIRY